MDRHMAESLDRWITGNYGEDQFSDHDDDCFEWPGDSGECATPDCHCWCHRDDPEETYARLSMLEEEV